MKFLGVNLRHLLFIDDYYIFFSSRRRHTRYWRDWSSDVCSSDLAPVDPGLLLGAGLLFSGVTGVVGLALGAEVLQTAILQTTLPVLGDVKLVTSLFFDIGVYLIVLGLVLDVLRSLARSEEHTSELQSRQ